MKSVQWAVEYGRGKGIPGMRACVLSHVWLRNPMDYRPPGSSSHRIFQARALEWVAISYSRGSSDPLIEPTSPALAGGFLTLGSPIPGMGNSIYERTEAEKWHIWEETWSKGKRGDLCASVENCIFHTALDKYWVKSRVGDGRTAGRIGQILN